MVNFCAVAKRSHTLINIKQKFRRKRKIVSLINESEQKKCILCDEWSVWLEVRPNKEKNALHAFIRSFVRSLYLCIYPMTASM